MRFEQLERKWGGLGKDKIRTPLVNQQRKTTDTEPHQSDKTQLLISKASKHSRKFKNDFVRMKIFIRPRWPHG